VAYPPRRICFACRSTAAETIELSHEGRVITSTIVHVLETPEGARMMVQVADCDPESVQAGMMVALEFRLIRKEGKGGILCYGHKAVPAYPMGGEAEAELRAGETEVAHA
jgi:uncharacterized OB-fold protein